VTDQHPAGYSRAAGIALVVAAVAGAASQSATWHCDCCGHRYAGDHVPGRPCPCFEQEGRS
jgi:rubrerythrin